MKEVSWSRFPLKRRRNNSSRQLVALGFTSLQRTLRFFCSGETADRSAHSKVGDAYRKLAYSERTQLRNCYQRSPAMAEILNDFPIKATAANVFQAVSTPQGLDAWWTLRSSGQAATGNEYELWFGPKHD